MRRHAVMRWLALLLALAVMIPSAAFAEELPIENALAEIETTLAGDIEPEPEGAGEFALINLAEDVGEYGDEQASEEASDEGAGAEGEATPEEPEISEEPETPVPALVQTALKLGVKEKFTLTLEGGASAAEAGAVFVSSKPSVASVNKTTGAVTGLKKGSATISLKVGDDVVGACAVTVLKAPAKVMLSSSSLTLGVGEGAALKGKLPADTASALTFSSSNAKVATVDAAGRVTALKKGTATITVKTFNSRKATCRVTVKEAPKSVAFSSKIASVWLGDSNTPKVTLSKNSAGAYTLSSDNEAAVAVSGAKLKAVGLGSATITATTYNGLTATLSVEVCRKPVYRALLVGETTFPGTSFSELPGKKDISLMKSMLKNVKGAAGFSWTVTSKTNRTALQIHSDINAAFAGAQEGDVSLFYISTHGNEELSFAGDWPEYVGYLMAYPNYDYTNWYDRYTLTLGTLAEWLKAVPGQVIVIIDSCGSGAAIYGAKSNAAAYTPERFDKSVVNAFEAQDQGVLSAGLSEGAFVVQNKFYVLTSAGYREACYTKDGKYSYFTKWLTDGVATKGKMPADSNKNKLTTLNELYKYIKKLGDKTTVAKGSAKQHVQVYPSGSGFGLFYRK